MGVPECPCLSPECLCHQSLGRAGAWEASLEPHQLAGCWGAERIWPCCSGRCPAFTCPFTETSPPTPLFLRPVLALPSGITLEDSLDLMEYWESNLGHPFARQTPRSLYYHSGPKKHALYPRAQRKGLWLLSHGHEPLKNPECIPSARLIWEADWVGPATTGDSWVLGLLHGHIHTSITHVQTDGDVRHPLLRQWEDPLPPCPAQRPQGPCCS